jgi:hypothetical protein
MVNKMGVSPRKLYRPGMNTKVCEARTSLRWSAWLRRKAQRENMRSHQRAQEVRADQSSFHLNQRGGFTFMAVSIGAGLGKGEGPGRKLNIARKPIARRSLALSFRRRE